MTGPYLKVIYQHRAGGEAQRVVYVAQDGHETDISNVVHSIEVNVTAGDVARYTLRGVFPVVEVMEDQHG